MLTNYYRNQLIDNQMRGQAFTPPTTWYVGLLVAPAGARQNTRTYAVGNIMFVNCSDGAVHAYQCIVAGMSAASQPPGYTGAEGETVTDAVAQFTECSTAVRDGTFVECSYAGYFRVGVDATMDNFSGTQGVGTTTASTGTTGESSNNNQIVFGSPTSGPSYVWAEGYFDFGVGGNLCIFGPLVVGKTINSGDAPPTVSAGISVTAWG